MAFFFPPAAAHRSPWRTRLAARRSGLAQALWTLMQARGACARTMLVCLLVLAGPGTAQPVTPGASTAARGSYDIPPGPLVDALSQFAQQAGVAISLQLDRVRGLRSPGLQGVHGVEDGFAALLAGSGWRIRRTPVGYVLEADGPAPDASAPSAVMLAPVTVLGGTTPSLADPPLTLAGGQIARVARVGLLGSQDVMDTPFSLSSYTERLLDDSQATTLAEVVQTDAAVQSTGQPAGFVDSFYIRGFPVGEGNIGEVAFDGLYGVAPNYRLLTEYLGRVEVLKGATGMLYGVSPNGGVGGAINVVPKRALPDPLTRVSLRHAGGTQHGARLDLSRRWGSEQRLGLRLNAGHQRGDTAVDAQWRQASVAALALDYEGARTRGTLDLVAQHERLASPARPFSLAAGVALPQAPAGNVNPASAGWSVMRDRTALLRAEHDLSADTTLYVNAGVGHSSIRRLSDQVLDIVDATGTLRTQPAYAVFDVRRHSAEAGLRTRLHTGSVQHDMTLAATRYQDALGRGTSQGVWEQTTLLAPSWRAAQALPAPADVPVVARSRLDGLALANTLSLHDDRLRVVAGIRLQRVHTENRLAAATPHYRDQALTPLLGAVWRARPDTALYASYAEGLGKGETAPDTASNAGEVFAPQRSRQLEAGVKIDRDTMAFTVALFQLVKPSGQLQDGRYAMAARQRNRGLEFNLQGEVLSGLRVLGSVALTRATLMHTADPAHTGHQPVGVPRLRTYVGLEWDVPGTQGLTLTGAALHASAQYLDQANRIRLPGWTRIDLGARYATTLAGKPLVLRASLHNAFNRHYWSGVASTGAFSLGGPRMVLASASMDF